MTLVTDATSVTPFFSTTSDTHSLLFRLCKIPRPYQSFHAKHLSFFTRLPSNRARHALCGYADTGKTDER